MCELPLLFRRRKPRANQNPVNLSIQFDETKFAAEITAKLAGVKVPVQMAMGEQMRDIVMSNFGATGVDRPEPWPPLSDRSEVGRAYIRKVGRSYATLYESGFMAGCVRNTDELDGSKVSLSDSDVPYASKHHFGTHNMPQRRVFPIHRDGNMTDYSKEAVIDAAKQQLAESLK